MIIITRLCKKTCKDLHTLARTFKFVGTSKSRVFANSFITPQFLHCSLIWIFHSQIMERRINKIHKRVLRPIYLSDSKLTFKYQSKNLQALASEMFNAKLNISVEIFSMKLIYTETNKNNFCVLWL